jgi:hypothetical protein
MEMTNRRKEARKMKKQNIVIGLVALISLGVFVGYSRESTEKAEFQPLKQESEVANTGGQAHSDSSESRIVFLRDEEWVDEERDMLPVNAWVVGIDGKNPTKITSSGCVDSASWLDAETVAVVSNGDIWLVQITKEGKRGEVTRLTSFGDVQTVSCPPDGEWVFFVRFTWTNDEPDFSLCKIKKDGTGYQVLKNRLSLLPEECPVAQISASRKTVFYLSSSDPDRTTRDLIGSVDFEGGNDKIVYRAPNDADIDGFTSSQDGQRIAFSFSRYDENGSGSFLGSFLKELDVQRLEERTIVYEDGGFPFICSFMPGEKAILCVVVDEDTVGLHVLDLEQAGAKSKLLIEDASDADVWY